jgi:DUF1680 family protein
MIDSNPPVPTVADPPIATRQGPTSHARQAHATLRPLALDAVRLDPAGLLGSWQERNARATLPHCVRQLAAGGALGNLRRPPDSDQPHVGMWFSDSDVHKTLEAVAWQLGRQPDDTRLADFFETTVDLLESVQDADGYLNSYFQHDHPDRRWQDLSTSHELYCAGHLIQAAVAAARVGIGHRLLVIARRFADLLVERYGAGRIEAVCGHPEVETALVELFRVTGHRPYLDLARLFVDRRGHGVLGDGQFGAAYFQDHQPVRDAEEFTGHAVRQLYLLAGVVDVAVEDGDDELLRAAERLWESAFRAKTYLTGAHGSRHRDEAVGDPYELPPDRAYGETCAAIASFQWNWRMLLATGGHRYAEEMERVLYNGIAAATALDGEHFCYSNPLQLRTGHDGTGEDAPSRRLSWYSCACCPPNVARLLASLQSYVATEDPTGLQVHLYATGTIHGGHGDVRVVTDYPWHGEIAMTVRSASDDDWTLALRVPGWCAATVWIDGVLADVRPVDGYLRLRRTWRAGTRVVLRLPMPPRLVAAHPRVDAVRGCVALMRGPLVYCVEQADLPAGTVLEDVAVHVSAPIRVVRHTAGEPIPVALATDGCVRDAPTALYQPHIPPSADTTCAPITVAAVPYFLWGNRDPGPMRVWIPISAPDGSHRPEPDG